MFPVMCDVLGDEMKRSGLNVDGQAMDYNTIVQCREHRGPVTAPCWSGCGGNG
jgi:hypothetical protein